MRSIWHGYAFGPSRDCEPWSTSKCETSSLRRCDRSALIGARSFAVEPGYYQMHQSGRWGGGARL